MDWKRLFYETQTAAPDFPPRGVDISGNFVRFRTEIASVEAKPAWIDRWIDRANQKESSMAKLDEERRLRREEHQREAAEITDGNYRAAGKVVIGISGAKARF